MDQKDFDFIVGLKDEFFSQRKIQHSLNIILEQQISAWEPWWQVEFATFLYLHNGGHEWYREHHIMVDRRKDKKKSKLIADFIIRPKNHSKDKFILLELKQNKSITTCISNMAKDVIKLDKAKNTSIDQRSFWCVGVHLRKDKKIVKDQVKTTSAKYGIELFDIYTKFIPNTEFALTVF